MIGIVVDVDRLAELMGWHACNGYCRGDEHAEVVWEAHSKEGDLTEDERTAAFRGWCASEIGVEYLGHAPAPEATKVGEMLTTILTVEEGRGPIASETRDGDIREGVEQRAFLLRFRTPLPLTQLRAMLEGGAS